MTIDLDQDRVDATAILDEARAAAAEGRPRKRTKDDLPVAWQQEPRHIGYACCSRRPSPDNDGSLVYRIEAHVVQRPEAAFNHRAYLIEKRSEPGVDYVVVMLSEVPGR